MGSSCSGGPLLRRAPLDGGPESGNFRLQRKHSCHDFLAYARRATKAIETKIGASFNTGSEVRRPVPSEWKDGALSG